MCLQESCPFWNVPATVGPSGPEAIYRSVNWSYGKNLFRLTNSFKIIQKMLHYIHGSGQRDHGIDFAGPFLGTMFLIVVDAYSKWTEVVPMTTTSTTKTVEELTAHNL